MTSQESGNNTKWWLIGGAAAAVIVVGGAITYFALGSVHSGAPAAAPRVTVAHTGEDAMVAAANDAASSETGGLCDRALIRAQNYGVVPASTSLTSKKTETGTEGRYTCAVKAADGATFTLAVDQTCDDVADHGCLALHTVTQSDGRTLFERL